MDTGETSSAKPNKLMHRNRNQQQDDKPRREHPPKTHSFNKRPVSKPFQRKCDIYVSNKSNFQVIICHRNNTNMAYQLQFVFVCPNKIK